MPKNINKTKKKTLEKFGSVNRVLSLNTLNYFNKI